MLPDYLSELDKNLYLMLIFLSLFSMRYITIKREFIFNIKIFFNLQSRASIFPLIDHLKKQPDICMLEIVYSLFV